MGKGRPRRKNLKLNGERDERDQKSGAPLQFCEWFETCSKETANAGQTQFSARRLRSGRHLRCPLTEDGRLWDAGRSGRCKNLYRGFRSVQPTEIWCLELGDAESCRKERFVSLVALQLAHRAVHFPPWQAESRCRRPVNTGQSVYPSSKRCHHGRRESSILIHNCPRGDNASQLWAAYPGYPESSSQK